MVLGLEIFTSNLGISFENLILLVIMLAGLIFYAKDVKLGALLHMMGFGCAFIVFYVNNLSWVNALVLMLMFFSISVITLFFVGRGQEQGVVI